MTKEMIMIIVMFFALVAMLIFIETILATTNIVFIPITENVVDTSLISVNTLRRIFHLFFISGFIVYIVDKLNAKKRSEE